MTKIKYILISLALLLCLSCTNFLNVKPKGEILATNLFRTAEGYEDAINGVYAKIANDESLYAGKLRWIPEALAYNVNAEKIYQFYYLQQHKWDYFGVSGSDGILNQLWESTYEAINYTNSIIRASEKGGLDQFENSPIYRGEMLAMRAMLHLELIKLFAPPVWNKNGLNAQAIPYVTKYAFTITPFYNLGKCYDLAIKDLLEAEELLAKDKTLLKEKRTNIRENFFSGRITHLNIYAVQSLLARTYLSLGQLDKAEEYALKVINSNKFTFRPKEAFIQPDNGTLDLNETILGTYSIAYNTNQNTKYAPFVKKSLYFILPDAWKDLYSDNDYRKLAWFDTATESLIKEVNSLFYEGGATNAYDGKSILGASLIRLPEMYFIVAEANLEKSPAKAREYFDKVIESRGLETLTQQNKMLNKAILLDEKRKEFYGEGLTWFDMKNNQQDVMFKKTVVFEGANADTYTIPIPVIENNGRENIK